MHDRVIKFSSLHDHTFFYAFFYGCCTPPFLQYYYIMVSLYLPLFFHFLFTNREYNGGYFRTTPCFCLHIVNNLQNTKYTKYKIFRRFRTTKCKIYFLY